MDTNLILHKFQSLPIKAQHEIVDFIDFLNTKYLGRKDKKSTKPDKFAFDWEGGLSEFKFKTTSVELQHQANQWR